MHRDGFCVAEVPQLVLASEYDGIELVERVLTDLVHRRGWGCNEERQALTTAAREAVANAIRHGNGPGSDQPIRLEVETSPEGTEVFLRVTDHGPGFDPTAVPDPTAPENLLRPSGRGIFYMRQLMDSVEFAPGANGGTVVTMSLRAKSPGNSPVEAEGRKER